MRRRPKPCEDLVGGKKSCRDPVGEKACRDLGDWVGNRPKDYGDPKRQEAEHGVSQGVE